MKITLDQETLRQAVISHLQSVGVTASILRVDFRYTRVPYAVFAEVELSETKLPTLPTLLKPPVLLTVREVIHPMPLVDPNNVEPIDPPDADESPIDSSTPNGPLFGD